ncbi:UDP-glycosyltransferase 82A1 [Silene latifolia]|uniref:UDP-glycosyltransferase 82A1 n=1 Tax=Silene latifolia TaxID=37657 RepID=UPI003D771D53
MGYDKESKLQTSRKKTVIMVPYPAQGHVTPMLNLASCLTTYGFKPLIILPEFIHRSIFAKVNAASKGEIDCKSIPDGLDETEPRDFFAIEMAMEDHMPAHLDRLIRNLNDDCNGDGDGVVACMIVDVLASWAINVGKQRGIKLVGFWPAMLATYSLFSSIPQLVQTGHISDSGLPKLQGHISHLYQPPLKIEDLPWLIGTQGAKIARFKFWARTMERSELLRCILVNSFPNETQSGINSSKWASNQINGPKIYPIGPLRSNGLCESPSFWKEDESCLDWLNQQKPNSVVYISFGSWVSPIGEAKVRNLALSLEELRKPFIWVLGPSWRNGLPKGYIERVENFGKIVAWAPQMVVLRHVAIGCYLTHCGWNSTMEAIECKKTMLCLPVAGDQFLNCEYIVNVWKIGVKMSGVCFADVSDGINRVMEDRSMKKRIEELNEKVMGEEANLKTKNDMLFFVNDVMRDQLLSTN